jgi:two-component system nitrogen regulation sensor histidine kinase NtrY
VSLRRRTGSLVGLLSVILLYVVLIVLVLVFAGQVLGDLSFSSSSARLIVIVLGSVFPVLLLAFVIVNLVRVVREHALARPGSRLKLRILFFFMVVVLLSSVPQGVLSVSFIRSAIGAWFSEDTGVALEGGQEIALAIHRETERELQEFAESPYTTSLLEGLAEQPARVWERLQGVNPGIDSMQVFDGRFAEVFAGGDQTLWLEPLAAAAARERQVARESTPEGSFLRVRLTYRDPAASEASATSAGEAYAVIFGSRLPEGFDRAAGRLTDALEYFIQLDRFQSSFITAIGVFYAFFFVPLVLLSLLVSFFLSDEIMRPIVNLEEATRRVAEGDFSTRILSRRGDELSILVGSFNRMVSELERTREKIIQTEKIAAWQEIAQRLAHEVKNPLTPIRLAAERSLRKYEQESEDFDEVFRTSVQSIVSEVDNLSSLLSEFREFSRLPAPSIQAVQIAPLVGEVINAYAPQTRYEVDISTIPVDITVRADPSQLRQAIANLVKNATEAMPDGGVITVRADVVTKGSAAYCRLQVEDTGEGIPLEQQREIFDPYMTTKSSGTGLGLAIVQRVIFDHHGQIWFESQPGAGTTFYIDLPLHQPHSADGEPRR